MITPKQFLEMEARVAPRVADLRTPDAVDREGELHDQIEDYCISHGYLYFHQRMDRPAHGMKSFPDFVIWMPGVRFVALELKSKTGKASADQRNTIAWFHKFGFAAEVVDNMADAIRVLETKPTNNP